MDFGQLWDFWVQLWPKKWVWPNFQPDHQANPEIRPSKYSKIAAVLEFSKIGRSPSFFGWSSEEVIFLFDRFELKGL